MPHDWEGLGVAPAAVGLALQEAATRLREGGWCQGKFADEETGAQDAVQALASVVGITLKEACRRERRLDVGPCALLGAALERATARVGQTLSVWNDLPERTLEEVARALETA